MALLSPRTKLKQALSLKRIGWDKWAYDLLYEIASDLDKPIPPPSFQAKGNHHPKQRKRKKGRRR